MNSANYVRSSGKNFVTENDKNSDAEKLIAVLINVILSLIWTEVTQRTLL